MSAIWGDKSVTRKLIQGFLLASVAAAMIFALRQEQAARQVSDARAGRLQAFRKLVGSQFSLDSIFDEDLSVSPALPKGVTAVLVLSPDVCLKCYSELSRWKRLAAAKPSLRMALVLLGSDSALAKRLAREEHLPFPVVADPARRLSAALGVHLTVPLRLLLVDGRVAIAAEGSEDSGVGFIEGLSAIAAPGLSLAVIGS